MLQVRKRDLSLRRAFAASLGLHALFALFFPVFDRPPSAGVQPVERISFVHVTQVRIARSTRAQPLPRAMRRIAPARSAAQRPRARRNPVVLSFRKRSIVPATYVASTQTATAVAGPEPTSAPIDAAREQPRAQETGSVSVPESEGAPHSAGRKDVGGVMPFGADLPEPVLDPNVRAELSRRFGAVHVTLIVTVGDDGRTKSVEFHPPLDARLQAEISALLAAANWDAAVCGGGIPCTGRTTITP